MLRRFVDPSATKDYSWALPNRRYTPLGYISPGTVSDGISHGAICVDTSGSLDTAALQKLGGEAQSLLDEGAVDKLTIVFCDTQVNRAAEYTKGDVIDFTCLGRGGTRFSPAFNWLEENTTDLQFVVYMTDLDCTDWGEAPWPVLWAVVGNLYVKTAAELDRKVPFGECMLLK